MEENIKDVTARILQIIARLVPESKLLNSFEETIKVIFALEKDWIQQNKKGIPNDFKIIERLATSQDDELLPLHLANLCIKPTKKKAQKKPVDKASQQYDAQIKQVLEIVQKILTDKMFEEFGGPEVCFIEVLAFLSIEENNWKDQLSVTNKNILPPAYSSILALYNRGDEKSLQMYMKKTVQAAVETNSMETLKGQIAIFQEKNPHALNEGIVAVLGTTLTVGLSTLHIIVPSASGFKDLLPPIDNALLNPALSSTYSIAGVSGALIAGLCVWNAYLVCKGKRTKIEAKKSIMDSVTPMAISSLVGYAAATAFLSTATPLWTTMGLFCGVGIASNVIATPFVKWYSSWIFYDLPREQAIKRAYNVLELTPEATDKEVKSAYRQLSRRYHPDMFSRRNLTENEMEESNAKLLEVQQAFEFIISIRLEKMDKADAEGMFSWMRSFFSRSPDPENEKAKSILEISN